ncbi:MAG: Maf-like protein [Candidatus Magnetoglobus multicellularis str. Araruama]|uniref:dTTP/UTP pyrophosphatase n=1 Tax=Candidatus Magnetoglobus multicellularis str. Araruama TaxID=890399 RepID=A0A1V1PCQ8_9BACT|nr:MAG: Maf-like protein [Candidatus Magnetoglobus multicellularis str. Araruama]
MNPIILASQSPRRKQLLEMAGINFTIVPADIDETPFLRLTPSDAVIASAKAKADHVGIQFPNHWIIAADTIVVIDNTILGKPDSKKHAREMLKKLSNRTHEVLTGYTICSIHKDLFFSDVIRTAVSFKQLSESEISWYLQTNEPDDKAGAYAIQGIGAFMIKSIQGSYTNVVGLPVCEVIDLLMKQHIIKRMPT